MQVSAPTRASSAAAAIRANPKDVEDTQNAVRFVGGLGANAMDAMAQQAILHWMYCKRIEHRAASAAMFGKIAHWDSDETLLAMGGSGIVVTLLAGGDIMVTISVNTGSAVSTYSVSRGDIRTYFLVAMNIVISNSAPPHFSVVDERGSPSAVHFMNFVTREFWESPLGANDNDEMGVCIDPGTEDQFAKWMTAIGTATRGTSAIKDTERPRVAEYISGDPYDKSPHELELISMLQGAIDPVL